MNVCSICGYKVVSNKVFEVHKLTHEIKYEPEVVVETSKEELHDVVQPEEITIRFMKPVEIFINAKAYIGKEIKVKDMGLASEIVRIAREAYGPTILA